MELPPTNQHCGAPPQVTHVKREFNEWADALTNQPPDFVGFDPANRYHFDLTEDRHWHLWQHLKHPPRHAGQHTTA